MSSIRVHKRRFGLPAHGLVPVLIALCAITAPPVSAAAPRRFQITQPVARSLSGPVAFAVSGVAQHALRVRFEVDGHTWWIAVKRPYRYRANGLLNTRSLRNGIHVLTVKAVYRHHATIASERVRVDNPPPRAAAKRAATTAGPGVPAPPRTVPGAPGPTAQSASLPPTPNTTALDLTWRPTTGAGFVPLADSAAAAAVTPEPENRPVNTTANQYVPTTAELQAFRSALDPWNRTPVQANPYNSYVTGDYAGTTDEIIQWAAAKWGIPVDWLRAQYMQESGWCSNMLGDRTTVSPAEYNLYPPQARVPGRDDVYESMGISQIKWRPDGSVGAGTEPLRRESTAFNVDYHAASLRFYYDDPSGVRSSWRDPTYLPGQTWNSVGGWFNPYPWNNPGQQSYVQDVQHQLVNETWTRPYRSPACAGTGSLTG